MLFYLSTFKQNAIYGILQGNHAELFQMVPSILHNAVIINA